MNRLHKYLPIYHKNSDIYTQITQAETIEFNRLDSDIEDIEKQYNVDSATWGLVIYEKELGLPIAPDLDIEIRRSLVKARLLMRPPGSKASLVAIIGSFVEDAEIEEYFSEYKFEIVLKTKNTIEDKLSHIRQIVEDVKPAHLDYLFVICYLTDLLLTIRFSSWESKQLIKCGTIRVNGEEYNSTQGKSYDENAYYNNYDWVSELLEMVSDNNIVDSVQGSSFNENTSYTLSGWASELVAMASEINVIDSAGTTIREDITDGRSTYLSKPLTICSENSYVRGVKI